jgi:hypothetical protein
MQGGLFVVDRDNMGGQGVASNDQIHQELEV